MVMYFVLQSSSDVENNESDADSLQLYSSTSTNSSEDEEVKVDEKRKKKKPNVKTCTVTVKTPGKKGKKQNGDHCSENESTSVPPSITTVSISKKSAEVVLLMYTEADTVEKLDRDMLLNICKSMKTQSSLVKSLDLTNLMKVTAVKLIANNKVVLKKDVLPSNIKKSDITKVKRS